MLLGLVVFVVAYLLLAVPPLGRLVPLGRPGIALAGAALVVLVLQVTPLDAWHAIRWDTLALLTGMMLLVAALDGAHAFTRLAAWLARRLPTPRRLLVGSMVAVAVLSALVLNDAVVLFFTPVLVRAARAMGTSPLPLLVAEAFAANIGSAATPVGNPQNATIALAQGLGFTDFLVTIGPVSLIALAMAIGVCLLAFRRELGPWRAQGHGQRRGDGEGPMTPPAPLPTRSMLSIPLACVALALAGFVVGPRYGIPLWASALGAGVLALLLSPLARASPLRLARGVDVGILALFVGLFVLLQTVRQSGLLETLAETLHRGGSGTYVTATALLSNLVSNVPAVLLLLPGVQSAGQALLLAAASTFAGNATFLGSAATVIVAETARREGAEFSVSRFTIVGLPLAVATLGLAWLVLG